ncbi:MAG: DUF5123 domain-containing protein [Paludibacter sp.]|nr:DUF5123 domain-containing protein [Paludibacter sp.]
MKKINFKIIFLTFILAAGFFVSCVEEPMLGNPDRLFRPIVKTATYNTTWIKLEWDRYTGAKSYEITLSVDSFQNVVRLQRTDSTQFTFTGLKMDQKYQIRIRSYGDSIMANGDTIKSEYYVLPDITTLDYPTKLITPLSSDIIDNSVRLSWNVTSTIYSRIDVCINKDSTAVASINLSAQDNIDGVKIVTGLNPATTYYLKIYDGDAYMGKKIVKTLPSQIFEGEVVDLRDISDEDALNKINQIYIDSLGTVYPAGFNLVLSGGTIYTLPTINIPVSVNIVTGLSFKGKAIMQVNGSIGIKTATSVGSVKVDKIFFTEGNVSGKLKTDANFGGTYLFNFNQADGNLTNLSIENCDVKYKRGFVRLQTTATIEKLTINNCLVDSIGGYGIVNMDNAGALVNNLEIKNSTFSHFDGYLCRDIKSTVSPNSILIENITTCYAPASTRYFFEITDRVLAGGITIKNSIFGSVLTQGTTVNGIRVGTGTNVTIDNCFKTSDLIWSVAAGATDPTYPIDCEDLGKTSTEIFDDPANYNFKVTNSILVNKVGDPRWWK